MIIIRTISEMKSWLKEKKAADFSCGLVPTMGFFHEGHLALMNMAREENDCVVVSVFVNPLQFGEGEDFEDYPRDERRDRQLAEQAGVDVLFIPDVKEMYPDEMSATITVHKGTDVLCGAKRPGHFNGVATVVMKLFHIISPNRAYFGKKDAQQLAIIERLVSDFNMDIQIVRGETVREADGLAKSSRNVRLAEPERREANYIFETLSEIKGLIVDGNRKDSKELEALLLSNLAKRLSGIVDYAEIRGFPSLERMEYLQGEIIIATAVKYSKVRLIDNIICDVN